MLVAPCMSVANLGAIVVGAAVSGLVLFDASSAAVPGFASLSGAVCVNGAAVPAVLGRAGVEVASDGVTGVAPVAELGR